MSVNLGSAHGDIVLDGAGVTKGVNQAASSLQQLERAASQTGASFGALGNVLGLAGTVIVGGLTAAVKAAASFNAQMSEVQAVSGASGEQMAQLGALAQKMGADTVFSSKQAAQGIAELAKAGVSVTDVLGGGLQGALDLAAAGSIEVGRAAEIAAKALNIFGLEGSQASHVADLFAAGANKSATSVDQMAAAFNQSAAVANQMGISIEELTGSLALFAQRGLEGSDAGTSLKTALIALTNPSKDAAATMERLGIAAYDSQGRFVGLAGLADQLKTSMAGLSQEERNAALATIFGSDAIRVASALYSAGGQGVKDWTAAVNDSGAASRVAATKLDNLAGSFEQLKGSVETAAIGIGQQIAPDLRRLADAITETVNAFTALDPATQRTIVHVAEVAAGLLLAASVTIKLVAGVQSLAAALSVIGGLFVTTTARTAAQTAANVALTASAERSSVALTGMGKALATLGIALAAAEVFIEALSGQTLPQAISSLVKYGDLLEEGRKNAERFFGQNKDDAAALAQHLDQLRARQSELNAESAKYADISAGALGDLLTGQTTRRNLAINNIEVEIEKTKELIAQEQQRKQAELDLIQTQSYRARFMQGAAGPIARDQFEVQGPPDPKTWIAYGSALQTAAIAAGQIGTTAQQARAVVQQLGGVANETAGQIGFLSESYFENQRAAAALDAALQRVAVQQGIAAQLQQLAQGYQSVQQATGPLVTALDQINAKRAQGLPLTAQESALLRQIPGYLGEAATAYNALTIQQAEAAINAINLAGGVNAIGGSFAGAAGQAGGLAGELNRLAGATRALESAFGALGTEQGKLSTYYNTLEARVTALNEKKKEGKGLSADEANELATLQGALKTIGDQMGVNAAQQRQYVLDLIAVDKATKTAQQQQQALADALAKIVPPPIATDNLKGLTDGLGNIAPAAGKAVTAIQGVTVAAQAIPAASIQVVADVATLAATKAAIAALASNPPIIRPKIETPPNPLVGLTGAGPSDTITVPVTVDPQPALTAIGQVRGALATVAEPVAGPIAVTVDTAPALIGIGAVRGALAAVAEPVAGPIAVNVDPAPALVGIGAVRGALAAVAEPVAGPIAITVDPSNAVAGAGLVRGALASVAEPVAGPIPITADPAPAIAAAQRAADAIKAIPTFHDTLLSVDDQATGPVLGLINTIRQVPSSLYVQAVVDTSGALAAIADLRAHMPASPAEKGPFRTLPNWHSVFASLEPAGDAAVATTQSTVGRMAASLQSGLSAAQETAAKSSAELITTITGAVKAATEALGAIREVQLPGIGKLDAFSRGVAALIAVIIAAAGQFDGPGLEAAAKFAEAAGKIVGLVAPSVAAFKALADVVQPTADQLGVFSAGVTDLTLSLVNASRLFDADGLAGAVVLAEAATKVVALVKPAIEAFAILPRVMQPTGDQLGVLTQGVIDIVLSLVFASRLFDSDGLNAATDLAAAAGQIIALVAPAVAAFKALAEVTQPTADQLGVFTQGIIDISLSLVNASRLFTAQGLAGATALADAALKILGLIKPAVEGFKLLPGIMQPTGDQLGVFTAGITDLTLSLVNAGRKFTTEGLSGATALADAALKILSLIKPAIEGFRLLPSIVGVSSANVATFQQGVVAITTAIVQAGRLFAADALTHAQLFADTAAKSIGLIGSGVTAFKALNSGDFALPDASRLGLLVQAVRQTVIAIGEAARTVAADLVTQAAEFADGAGKSVALVGGAIQAFANIADFVPPSPAQIDALKNAILLTVRRVAEAAREIDAEAVKVAGEFSESASKAVGLIGGAISAFTIKTNVDKDGNAKAAERLISTAEIDQLVALTRYAVGQLIGVARSFDKGQLAQLATFADAASKGFGALRGILDSFTAVTKDKTATEGQVTPQQAIEQLITLFTAGIGRLSALALIANQYRTIALTIRQAMSEAGAALAEALGGLSLPQGVTPQTLALARGGGAFTIRQEVVHTFSPIDIRFLGDNGTWVVRSLQTDGQARHQVADMIAGELIAAAPAGAGA